MYKNIKQFTDAELSTEWYRRRYKTPLKGPLKIGNIIKCFDGRIVKINSGCYLSDGRISNHWSWQEVFENGQLGPEESGYGWGPPSY